MSQRSGRAGRDKKEAVEVEAAEAVAIRHCVALIKILPPPRSKKILSLEPV